MYKFFAFGSWALGLLYLPLVSAAQPANMWWWLLAPAVVYHLIYVGAEAYRASYGSSWSQVRAASAHLHSAILMPNLVAFVLLYTMGGEAGARIWVVALLFGLWPAWLMWLNGHRYWGGVVWLFASYFGASCGVGHYGGVNESLAGAALVSLQAALVAGLGSGAQNRDL